MPFLDDIAAALERATDGVQANLGPMMVEDCLNGLGRRTVLLLESPHRDEIDARPPGARHPLAGSSGRNVTAAFAEHHSNFYRDSRFNRRPYEPIGSLLRRLQGVDADERLSDVALNTLNSLGLMNVSRLPLDSDAYCLDVRRRYSDLLCYFEAIKARLEALKIEKLASGIQYLGGLDADLPPLRVYKALRNDLIDRLPRGEDVEVIPCGKVARVFYYWAISHRDGVNYGIPNDFVPHPSYGWWTRPKYRNRIRMLVERVHERAPVQGGD